MRSLAPAAVLAVAALTGCSGGGSTSHPAPPGQSAAAACSDFRHWFLGLDGNYASMKNLPLLRRAVSEAPSGSLYADMSSLESDAVTVRTLGDSGGPVIVSAAYTVEQDCAAVNPDS